MGFKKSLFLLIFVVCITLLFSFWIKERNRVKFPFPARIVCFGNSLTSGVGAEKGKDYPSQLALLLKTEVINSGIPGDTTSSALQRIEKDVLRFHPDLVIILLGGNDFLKKYPLKETERNIREIVERIKEENAQIILVSPLPFYDSLYKQIAKETGILFIPHILRGILTDPELKSDEVHPNEKGYFLMAKRIERFIRRHIE